MTKVGIVLLLIGVATFIASNWSPTDNGEDQHWRIIGFCFVMGGILFIVYSFSDSGGDEIREHRDPPSFPISRILWFIRPVKIFGVRTTGRIGGPAMILGLLLTLVLIPVAAFLRLVQLLVLRGPLRRDVYSLEGGPEHGGFVFAEVVDRTEHEVWIRTLLRSDRRRHSFYLRETTTQRGSERMTLEQFHARKPRFVWRGPMSFWNTPGRDQS